MKTETHLPPPAAGLSSLASVPLNAANQRLHDRAAADCGGPAPWRHRKLAEIYVVLVLTQICHRLILRWFDVREAFLARLILKTPVPCLPDPKGQLQIVDYAELGLAYRQEALRLPQPGYSFVQILYPTHVWHSNVALDHGNPICLGAKLPAGIRVLELILMTYGALTFQAGAPNDAADPAGVLNPDAARWWQQNLAMVPLSRAPFLNADDNKK